MLALSLVIHGIPLRHRVFSCILVAHIVSRGTMTETTERPKTITARVDTDKIAFLDALAALQDRDRSYLINEALEQYIAHRRWMVEEIQKAVAEADAGAFLSDDESNDF